ALGLRQGHGRHEKRKTSAAHFFVENWYTVHVSPYLHRYAAVCYALKGVGGRFKGGALDVGGTRPIVVRGGRGSVGSWILPPGTAGHCHYRHQGNRQCRTR